MSVLWPSTITLDTAYIWKHSIFEWPLGQSSSSSTPAKYFHNFTALVPGLKMFSHAKERDPRRETVSKFSIFFELLSSGLFLFLHRERERRSSVATFSKRRRMIEILWRRSNPFYVLHFNDRSTPFSLSLSLSFFFLNFSASSIINRFGEREGQSKSL